MARHKKIMVLACAFIVIGSVAYLQRAQGNPADKDPEDEPSAEASLIYRPVPRPMAKAKKWRVEDIPIASKAW